MIARILRASVSGRTWRELAYVLVSLLPAVPAFALALLGAVAAALSLLTVGLPVLVAVLVATRGAGVLFRGPARILGWRWTTPPVPRVRGPIRWGRAVLRDSAGWRALLYCFVKLPIAALAGYLGVVAVVVGLVATTYPAWWFLTSTGFGELEDRSWATTWLYVPQGLAVLLVWPWFLRLLVMFDRTLVGALLEPDPDRSRIAQLQAGRDALAADAATTLRRLERDLHDGTQARLVSVGLTLGRIDRRVTDPEVRELVASAQAGVTEALTELRDIVRGIHPPALDDGLPTAVETLAARSAVPVETTVELTSRPSDAAAGALYFTVAELLTNVARHAGASRARLRLAEDGDRYLLEVSDDGRGGASADGAGTGLAGLARRAAALDGTLRVDSPAGGPTAVTMTLPKEV